MSSVGPSRRNRLKICVAGEGAIGRTHLESLAKIDNVEVVSLAGGNAADTAALASAWRIPHWSLDLDECLRQPDIDGVILATPTPLHAAQVEQATALGKHVLVEIPMALSGAEAQRLAALERHSGLICMVAHSRRYAPPHQEMKRRILAGEFQLQHLVIETYFLRRFNMNARGQARSWTDSLLWHHACHGVDLASWLIGEEDLAVWGQAGPTHPDLGISMDLTIGMRSRTGVIVSMALSFNNDGPAGGFHRYIGAEGTFHAARDTLQNAARETIQLPGQSITNQDRAFISAIQTGAKPLTSFTACLPAMMLLDRIQATINSSTVGQNP